MLTDQFSPSWENRDSTDCLLMSFQYETALEMQHCI